jgi:anti-sigma regulatory factor (Ser/Thr protein kinase)
MSKTNDEAPSTVSSTATEIKEVLPSQIRAISPFVDRLALVLKPFIEKSKAVVGAEEDIETAVREALANAIIHGNRQDPHKSVYVTTQFAKTGKSQLRSGMRARGLMLRQLRSRRLKRSSSSTMGAESTCCEP